MVQAEKAFRVNLVDIFGSGRARGEPTAFCDHLDPADRCKPDLMIVDVLLGRGSGISAVTAILRAGPVPHIFVSGDLSKVKAAKPDSVAIRKPYREADIAQAIRRALDAAA